MQAVHPLVTMLAVPSAERPGAAEGVSPVEIRVLGPVEVSCDGESLHFARRQQRLILGILALAPISWSPPSD
ncbi:MAG: hypothetical protein JXA67_21905 [Micromonosporaceae bacterium]|nr:hypothetical protein [Micromonosporaceae bacterium]